MLRVASGLDSLVLGEPQILGQMKTAFSAANEAGTTGKILNRLFQHTFKSAKQVRTDTAIGSSPVSVAFAAVSLGKQIFGELSGKTVLLIGAGETIELAARHLHEQGIGRMIIANRTVEKAHHLAEEFGGYAISLTEISDHLAEADIVISSTASPLPILGKGAVESALKSRRHQPMFMVDIAVPRDIEAEVDDLDDVYLYTVDDLQEVIQENMKSRQDAAKQAEEIIDSQVVHFMEWIESQDSVSTIRAFRAQADRLKAEMLEKSQKMLAAGEDPKHILEVMAHQLTNKLIHSPCNQLRNATSEERPPLLEATRTLFNLDNH
jgi:glutamyl-tRNA reductase